MGEKIQQHQFPPSSSDQPIFGLQSASSRALNVGYIEKDHFVPGRLHMGIPRMIDTLTAMTQTFQLPEVQSILQKYPEEKISTITVMREGLAYQLPQALYSATRRDHFGDAFVGATHKKGEGAITTDYGYENTEGLTPDGLWSIGDSICMGRNLGATLDSLLSKYQPQEILFVSPIASRKGINRLGAICASKNVKTTFVVWGGLFGVGDNDYDMPWGHPDTEPIDLRDREIFVNMYGPHLCMGGDFGNDYFSPSLAKNLYADQLQEWHITPNIPSLDTILKVYEEEEILTR